MVHPLLLKPQVSTQRKPRGCGADHCLLDFFKIQAGVYHFASPWRSRRPDLCCPTTTTTTCTAAVAEQAPWLPSRSHLPPCSASPFPCFDPHPAQEQTLLRNTPCRSASNTGVNFLRLTLGLSQTVARPSSRLREPEFQSHKLGRRVLLLWRVLPLWSGGDGCAFRSGIPCSTHTLPKRSMSACATKDPDPAVFECMTTRRQWPGRPSGG